MSGRDLLSARRFPEDEEFAPDIGRLLIRNERKVCWRGHAEF
jgi:hypothetical protein